MEGAQGVDTPNDDIEKYRVILSSFIAVVDRIPFIKPTKTNKIFAIPYRTLFTVLKEYAPLDSNQEANIISNINDAFKTEEDKNIETSRMNLICHLRDKNTLKRLDTALVQSIECYDDVFTRVLDFFQISCSHMVARKRKTGNTGQKKSSNLSGLSGLSGFKLNSPAYVQFLASNPFDTLTTEKTDIQSKINLKSSEWVQLKKKVYEPKHLAIMMSSIFHNQNLNPNIHISQSKTEGQEKNVIPHINGSAFNKHIIDPKDYLGLSTSDVNAVKLYLFAETEGSMCVLNNDCIIGFLTQLLRLGPLISGSTAHSLESFVRRHFNRISKLDSADKEQIFPLTSKQFTLRHISRLIKKSEYARTVLKNISDKDCLFKTFTFKELVDMPEFEFAKKLTRIQKSTLKRYFGKHIGFSDCLPDQLQFYTVLKSKDMFDETFLRYLSFLYNIHIVLFNARSNKFIDFTNDTTRSNYILFMSTTSDSKGIKILKYRDCILIKHSNWREWLDSLTGWKPAFSEIWDYFKETGTHVPPICGMDNNKGLTVFGVPFVTQNYKTYIKHVSEDAVSKGQLSIKSHGIYCMQYEDAFKFVKRQESKRYQLHYKSSYVETSVRQLLRYFPLNEIHHLILENASHGIFVKHVSPIFKKVAEFDNATMLKWWMVSNRFHDKVRGYFTEFGPLYYEEIYDTSINPVTETCIGFQWDKIKALNYSNIHSHGLTPQNVVLIIASMYIDASYTHSDNTCEMLDSIIPVHKDTLRTKTMLNGYFQTQHLLRTQRYQGLEIRDDIIYDFVEDYFITYGPFAVFNDGILDEAVTEYIFNLQIYFNNSKEIDDDISECIRNVVDMLKSTDSETHLSIPFCTWKIFIQCMPKTEKYTQLKGIPNVPCIVKLTDGTTGVLQSFNANREVWRIVTENRKCYNLPRDHFEIVDNDRVLPSECIIYPLLVGETIPKFRHYIGLGKHLHKGTVVKKLDERYYLVKVEELNCLIKLEKDHHFSWKHGVMMKLEQLNRTEYGNVDPVKKYTEDSTYDKGFSNRGSKMRTKMYHPIRKDAYLPSTEDIKLPDYIREDEFLCKLLDKEYLNSIFAFINYTSLSITNDELYGTYGKIMDRHGEKSAHFSYEEVLMLVIDDLWKDMSTDRLQFNVTGVLNKLGDNVIDMKEDIIKNVYKSIGK